MSFLTEFDKRLKLKREPPKRITEQPPYVNGLGFDFTGGGNEEAGGGEALIFAMAPFVGQLVSYWKLDTGFSGSTSPDSIGTAPLQDTPTASIITPGLIVNAGHLIPSGGGTSAVRTDFSHPEFKFTNGDFSFVQWFRMTSDPGLDVNLIDNTGSVIPHGWPRGAEVSITAGTRKMFASVGTGGVWIDTAQTVGLSLATWYFYAVRFNLNANLITLKVFDQFSILDTVTAVAGIADYGTDPNNEQLRIAASRFTSGFVYDFDETGAWSKALDDSIISGMWNGGAGRTLG